MSAAQDAKERREWYKAHGICYKCGTADALKGKTLCADCADRQADYAAKNYWANKAEHLAKRHERQKKRSAERKAQGLCVVCGKREAQKGRTRCAICAEKDRRKQLKHSRKIGRIPYDLRVSPDVCYICLGEPMEGSRLCADCYKKSCEHLEIGRSKIKWENHPWRAKK